MSASGNKTVESRNAYLTICHEYDSEDKLKKRSDDSLYLTAKSPFRTRSCSPSVFKAIDSKSQPLAACSSVFSTITTTTPFTSASSLLEPNVIASSAQKPKIQVGMDRYITVLKRGRSPKSSKISSASKISREEAAQTSQNRFSLLQDDSNEPTTSARSAKPPPIYLRQKNSNALIKKLISVIGENSFHVLPLKRGNVDETKIQIYDEQNYRKVAAELDNEKMAYYTYQLKSAKGMQIVLKGIDSCVDPEEVKGALTDQGYKVKHVANVINREKIPQPMFRVELEPNDTKLKKNEIHPIYNLKYLLHRKITVEEPHKRSGPVQCHNCQEYGHTKSYCKLPTVCVVCGELHGTANCNKSKDDQKHKKCSNCGGNHTANYRGCPVYSFVKQSTQKQKITPAPTQNINAATGTQMTQPSTSYISYAAAVKTNSATTQNETPTNNSSNTNSGFNFSRLEATIDSLVQTINNFTTTMTSMLQEMLRMQSILLQAIVNKP